MNSIQNNLEAVTARIAAAARSAGRDADGITLVAVSKRHPAQAIREAYLSGHRHFGENYAQELRDKARELADLEDIRWHFIGHLQRNKAKFVVPSVHMMETVDSVRLVAEMEKQAALAGREVECLVQVNVGREAQKSGCSEEEVAAILNALRNGKGLSPSGLMTIPPWDLDADETRKYFAALARLRQRFGGAAALKHLSMGMSHDFEEAIKEGATVVRVGTAIFGRRPV